MPLNLFYTMVQKSQKWPKTQIKGGPALNLFFSGGSVSPSRLAKESCRRWRNLVDPPLHTAHAYSIRDRIAVL